MSKDNKCDHSNAANSSNGYKCDHYDAEISVKDYKCENCGEAYRRWRFLFDEKRPLRSNFMSLFSSLYVYFVSCMMLALVTCVFAVYFFVIDVSEVTAPAVNFIIAVIPGLLSIHLFYSDKSPNSNFRGFSRTIFMAYTAIWVWAAYDSYSSFV
ncbi:hypothetical protein KUV74_12525 [Halomonas sp. DP1Y21-3]|uniref:hypothetical protein n=1 Tax=Halomonas sp. DP1Y21-3 TaxID=2859080 RepID=UPI001C94E88D|nr:hypothetical protein [Halomonas sp. DP1Y21-3]MBY6111219.1 hypothetical protein [Halomonas sp. DP1Y21-3]